MTRLSLFAFGLALGVCAPATAQKQPTISYYGKMSPVGDTGPADPDGVGFTQKLGAAVPLDLTFYDHDGRPVVLRDLIGGKPTVLCLGYYRCPKLCNLVQGDLLLALKEARQRDPAFVAGGPFNVIVVSIDPRESPTTLARPKRQAYLADYDQRSDDTPGWWLLTANHGQGTDIPAADRDIHTLASAVGFDYTLSARGKDYVYDAGNGEWAGRSGGTLPPDLGRVNYDYKHSSGVVLLTPDGRVSSYILGLNYSGADLRLGLVMASGNTIGTRYEKNIAQYCQVYDQVTGHYKPTMRYVGWAAVPVLLGVGFMTYLTVRRGLREKPLTLPSTPPAPAA